MTITREQVADLQPGDVVAILYPGVWDGVEVSGPLRQDSHSLRCGPVVVRYGDTGEPALPRASLTVVSRAPRPLYVNHPRTEPVPGDVARDAETDIRARVWVRNSSDWHWADHPRESAGALGTVRLRLLVDGETGQAVQ